MRPENTPGKLHELLDNALSSSTSFNNWLKPGNEIHLARLCVILNLRSAARSLHIANSALEKSLAHSHHEDSQGSLQEFRHGQENAKAILDTLKYVRASLERGITLIKSYTNVPQDDVAALEFSLSFASECIEFWMLDHGIYEPSHIRSFILQVVQFSDNHSEIFANIGAHSDREVKELRALVEASRKASHETDHENGQHLHIGSAVHHLVSSMHIRNYLHHIDLPLISHHHQAHSGFTPEALNLQGLIDATELTLHLMATWSIHPFESASTSAIVSKISSEMTNYARDILLSIETAKMISNLAKEASGLFEGLSQDMGTLDGKNRTPKALLVTTNALKDSHDSLILFKDTRKAVHELMQDSIFLCEQGKLVNRGNHELEQTRDVLEHFSNNLELYVLWWTRMNMDLSCQENSSEQLLRYYCSMRKEQITAQWTNIRTSSTLYAEKTSRLKDIFPDLFLKSGSL